jgi:hypothetical protein
MHLNEQNRFASRLFLQNHSIMGFGSAVQRAVKAVVAEASDTVQKVHMSSSMTSAVRGLQHKIRTTIGRTWELHSYDPDNDWRGSSWNETGLRSVEAHTTVERLLWITEVVSELNRNITNGPNGKRDTTKRHTYPEKQA